MSKKTFQKHIKKAMVKVAFADLMNGKESKSKLSNLEYQSLGT